MQQIELEKNNYLLQFQLDFISYCNINSLIISIFVHKSNFFTNSDILISVFSFSYLNLPPF